MYEFINLFVFTSVFVFLLSVNWINMIHCLQIMPRYSVAEIWSCWASFAKRVCQSSWKEGNRCWSSQINFSPGYILEQFAPKFMLIFYFTTFLSALWFKFYLERVVALKCLFENNNFLPKIDVLKSECWDRLVMIKEIQGQKWTIYRVLMLHVNWELDLSHAAMLAQGGIYGKKSMHVTGQTSREGAFSLNCA